MRFVAVGDCAITRRIRHNVDAAFTDLVRLTRDADVAFANLEIMTPDEPWTPFSEYGGSYLAAEPYVLDELRWLGLNLFGVANNHAVDYTYHGLMDTLNRLRERDMTYAGAGHDLGAARAPAFLDTKAGRVGLVACASTFATSAQAAASRADMQGRPGISVLRHDKRYVVTQPQLDALKEIDEAMGTAAVERRRRDFGTPPEPESAGYKFLGRRFEVGDRPGVRTACNVRDEEAIKKAIADARRQADVVVVSLHGHEGQTGGGNDDTIADFIKDFAHAAIDAGADLFVGHGPHRLHGIEIYQGRPILYSLGNFMYMAETVARYPAEMYEALQLDPACTASDVHDSRAGRPGEAPNGFHRDRRFWQSVLPVIEWGPEGLKAIRLHPLELGLDLPRPRRGLARIADEDEGREILQHVADLSREFGTRIVTAQEMGRPVGVVYGDGSSGAAP